ncbi:DeoR family transcriptional regulator [Flavobacterium rakeshii]|uniref:DeoR family transcriptional regulator n=1 Tax=Flavobacterium rakeshii TaxID=1038845 RepID=A0A6N8HDE2_9FLAO|nr:DeoR/GlpR family DNA-binding transcription regulator [Flavobacterium rakeshii]MUV04040.1 DeoR family transcriptional regulator [Flavobacterium rakeshii]
MIKEERLQIILDQLSKDQKVLLGDLSMLLNVSEDTVRRDIKILSDKGLLQAVRGGAIAHSPIPHHYRARENYNVANKQIIAQKALSFLKDGQIVVFDGGTSALAVAQNLPKDLNITVVTNSFPVAAVIEDHPKAELIFAGGRLFKPSFITRGHETIEVFNNIKSDVCFMGVCALHPEAGLTALNYEDAQVNKVMSKMTSKVIALSTLEKLGTAEPYKVCGIYDIDVIISEASSDNKELSIYREKGVNII